MRIRSIIGWFATLSLLSWSTNAWAWVWTDALVDPLYGCSDTLHPDDEDSPEHEWSSIAATGTRFTLSDDQVTGAISIGFTFNFYERDYGNIYVSSNGFIGFLAGMDNGCCSGESIPSSDSINGIIAFMWDDLYPPNGNMYYQTIGDPGERMFIVEFNGVPRCCGTSNRVTAQVVLEEGTSNIYMHYVGDGDAGNTTTIGIENETGMRGVQIFHGYTNSILYNDATVLCSPLYLDQDEDGFDPDEDCDDTDPEINPDADEVCDGVDNDCDDLIDEGFDADDDGFPVCAECDDDNADINPEAEEVCNGIDDDCDDAIDEGFDTDSDGFTSCGGDCNDRNADINPDADEVCNSRDDDCDGETDEGTTTTYYGDFDRDGFGNLARPREACSLPAQHVVNSDDCDDTSAAVNPDAVEVCNDVDDNCNGEIDEGLLTTFYLDDDRDGFGDPLTSTAACSRPPLHVGNSTDCNDADRAVNPDAAELCDGIDNDCDGELDDGAPSETFYADGDGDGHGDPDSTVSACVAPEGYASSSDDCDDTNADSYPGATEVCDGADNNCNTLTDEGVSTSYYADADGDGFGDSEATVDACEMPAGYVANDDDCDDTSAAVAPGAAEACDGLDNDCNGTIDDGAPQETFYFDADGDGYGDPSVSASACVAPPGYVDNGDDCDDADDGVHPGASETCDGVDQDCNGTADDGVATQTYYADTDDDGFGDPSATTEACAAPDGYTDDDTDCDDDSDVTYPDATEIADMLDNNCNGEVDEGLDTDEPAPDESCSCTAVGSSQRSFLRSGLIRLILGWLGLI